MFPDDVDFVNGLTNLSDVMEIIEHDFANACDGGYIVVPENLGNKNAKNQNHALWLPNLAVLSILYYESPNLL